MVDHPKAVIAVLAVEHQPADPAWSALCQRIGVQLLWPDIMPSAVAHAAAP
jgi:hypothetical protein